MVDYSFYTSEFLGDRLTEEEFPYYARRAFDRINTYTLGRADEEDEGTCMAVCALSEILYDCEGREGISSESADGYSADYTDISGRLYNTAQMYIPATLFYRGVI